MGQAEVIIDIPSKTLKVMYITMLRIRKFEEKVAELLFEEEIKCPTHLYIGQLLKTEARGWVVQKRHLIWSNRYNNWQKRRI